MSWISDTVTALANASTDRIMLILPHRSRKPLASDMGMKAMQKLWGRKISDLGFSEFVNVLEYQCSKTGSIVVKISRFYPSSKTCSHCGHVLDNLPLSVREWTCPNCGAEHERDRNASINILRVGASTLLGEAM